MRARAWARFARGRRGKGHAEDSLTSNPTRSQAELRSPPQGVAPPRIRDGWYVLATSAELGRKPLKRALYGEPLVLFRTASGEAACLLDRCPHRNVPLSMGAVKGERLQCAYHGWEFDGHGACKHIPAFVGEPDASNRRVPRYAVVEQQGHVWVWGRPDVQPEQPPFSFRLADDPAYFVLRRQVRANGNVHMVAENALDVPHTAFLHGGLFRTDADRNEITAVVKRWHDHAECEYIGEPRPEGLIGRMLSPSGGLVTHFDRFFLPSIVEVEYRIGDENHILVNAACTPVDDYDTILYAVVALRTRLPIRWVRPLIEPFALKIFAQDAVMLQQQTDSIHRFGGQAYASTEVDLLGPHILKLMLRAERGELGDPKAEPWTREVRMLV